MARELDLSADEFEERIPSGQTRLRSRVHWARYYLLRAELLERPGRGRARISDRGRELLAESPVRIDNDLLRRFPEFVEWTSKARSRSSDSSTGIAVNDGLEAGAADFSPEERIDLAYDDFRGRVEHELLARVLEMSPEFFEDLMVQLLLRLGYGGDIESGTRLGRSGDGGVDGVIREDALGLEHIYVQAKRWAAGRNVGRQDVQAFAGSLDMHRARKGVFITTSSFSAEAQDYVTRIEKRIVLPDGEQLARLMFETDLGLTPTRTLDLKRIDSDFFEDSDDL